MVAPQRRVIVKRLEEGLPKRWPARILVPLVVRGYITVRGSWNLAPKSVRVCGFWRPFRSQLAAIC